MYVEIITVAENPDPKSRDVEMFVGPFLSDNDRREYIRRVQEILRKSGLNPFATKYIPCDDLPKRDKWTEVPLVGNLARGLESLPFVYVRSFPRT